jgi:peptidoglycan/LPS O-acetylase OafA/YrhL
MVLRMAAPAAPQPEADRDRLAFADGLRAVAVMWVVLHHLAHGGHVPLLLENLPRAAVTFLDLGFVGVTIFFVLSGYVMALTAQPLEMDGATASRFVLRRLLRLTPPLYAGLVLALAVAWVESVLQPGSSMPSPASAVAHLFYAQDILGLPRINDVYWTLAIEVQFYIAFALMLWAADALRRRLGWRHARLVVGAVAAAVSLPWAFGVITDPIWRGGFMGFWFSFVLGVVAFWCSQRMRHAGWLFLLLAAAVAASAVFFDWPHRAAAVATACALVVAQRMGAMHRWLSARWIRFVGVVSYSIYLVHLDVQGAAAFVLRRVLAPSLATDIVIAVALILLPIAAAWIVYVLVERPSIRWSRRIALVPRPPDDPARLGEPARA